VAPRRRRRALWAALAFLAYAVPVWGMLFVGRFPSGSLRGADDLRLWPDLALVAVLTGTLLLLGPARPVPSARDGRDAHRAAPRRPRGPVPVLAAAVAVAVVAGSAVSWAGFGRWWSHNGAKPYVTALRGSLAASRGPVVDTSVPDTVIPGWVQADFTSTDLVRLLQPDRAQGVVDGNALAASASGALRTAQLSTHGVATPPHRGFCGFARPRESTSWLVVPFDRAVPYYRASMLRLSLLVDDTTRLRIRVVDRDTTTTDLGTVTPPLTRGPHVVLVTLPYRTAVAAVDVEPTSAAGLCVPTASVVTASPR
jgi:hypothetical protein